MRFAWAASGAATTITNPAPDMVLVNVDPCSDGVRALGLVRVISTSALDAPCLSPVTTYRFGGLDHRVYAVSR